MTDLYLEVAYTPPPGDALLDGAVAVPTKWLLERVRAAGTSAKAPAIALGHSTVPDPREPDGVAVETSVTFSGKRYAVRGLPGHSMPEKP